MQRSDDGGSWPAFETVQRSAKLLARIEGGRVHLEQRSSKGVAQRAGNGYRTSTEQILEERRGFVDGRRRCCGHSADVSVAGNLNIAQRQRAVGAGRVACADVVVHEPLNNGHGFVNVHINAVV